VIVNGMVSRTLAYRVWVSRDKVIRGDPPTETDLVVPDVNPQLATLARQIVGQRGSPAEQAAAVEAHLRSEYGYSTTSSPDRTTDPVEWFLTDGREGHCEYFAASMVVLMRLLEVPARMVGGYSGGVLAPSGSELLVKQSNAHTWVEVWLGPDRGWVGFDPTPFEGVPGLAEVGGWLRFRWVWDQVQVFWDRNVLTYGLGEQAGLAQAFVDALAAIRGRVGFSHLVMLAGLTVLVLVAPRLLRGRSLWRARRGPASAAVERLVRRLRGRQVIVPDGATVRWIGNRATECWPDAASAVARLVVLAEEELYSPSLGSSDAAVRDLWHRVQQSTRP
jgi:hypothetical protein